MPDYGEWFQKTAGKRFLGNFTGETKKIACWDMAEWGMVGFCQKLALGGAVHVVRFSELGAEKMLILRRINDTETMVNYYGIELGCKMVEL